MSARGRVVLAVEFSLEEGGATDAMTLAGAFARGPREDTPYVLTDGGTWIVTDTEVQIASMHRDGKHASKGVK
jgi:hypothetical protein